MTSLQKNSKVSKFVYLCTTIIVAVLVVIAGLYSHSVLDKKKFHIQNNQADSVGESTTLYTKANNKDTIQSKQISLQAISQHNFSTSYTLAPKQYQKYPHQFPCVQSNKDQERQGHGFYYIKIHKTASTTMASVTKNIVQKHREKFKCLYANTHHAAYQYKGLKHRKANQPNSYLFTVVRDPTSRAISDYFYRGIIQNGEDVNLDRFKSLAERMKYKVFGQAGHQVGFMSTEEKLPEYYFWDPSAPEEIQKPHLLRTRVENLFNSYDFIGVSERLNESLVMLSFLLDLSLTEVTYHSFRSTSNTYVQGGGKGGHKCFKSVSAHEGMTQELKDYVESNEWMAITAADRLLHKTANEAMDNTIDNVIGRDVFKERLVEFERLLDLLSTSCTGVCVRCTSNGKFKSNAEKKCSACTKNVLGL